MRNILYLLIFIFSCCTNNSNNEEDIHYFRLVKIDTVKFIETQVPKYDISIGPDSKNVYLTEYKYAQKDDSTFELIPEMTRSLKSKKILKRINCLLREVDTTYDFTAVGAYQISARNKRYYVKKNAKLDSICKELILQIKGNNSQKVDFYEFHRKNKIPLPPMQGSMIEN